MLAVALNRFMCARDDLVSQSSVALLAPPQLNRLFVPQIFCNRNVIGRVIGKGGETIKALQHYTGTVIQVDQEVTPTRGTIDNP